MIPSENDTLEAFKMRDSKPFTQSQCEQAKYMKCEKRTNSQGKTFYYNSYEKKMTANICKNLCISSAGFTYAALYK